MKKHILALTMLLSTLTGIGQTNVYHPIPDSGAIWTEYSWWTNYGCFTPYLVSNNYTLFASTDTIISTHTYRKILQAGAQSSTCYPPTSTNYTVYSCALRQDTLQKKVYYVSSSSSSEYLLYDFNLNVGDTLPTTINLGNQNTVIKIDSVLVGTVFHKRFLLKQIGNSIGIDTSYALIEGIGSTLGLFNPIQRGSGESGTNLICFGYNNFFYPTNSNCSYVTGIVEINNLSNLKIAPNPFASSTNLTSNLADLTVTIYNLCGQPVKQIKTNSQQTILSRDNLPSGLYFLRVTKDNKTVASDKLVIVDN